MKSAILDSFVLVSFLVLKILKTVKILCAFCWVFHICICSRGCTMGRLGCDCFLIVLLIPCRHISRDATSPVISISLWSHRTCTALPFLQGGVLLCLTLSYSVLLCFTLSYCVLMCLTLSYCVLLLDPGQHTVCFPSDPENDGAWRSPSKCPALCALNAQYYQLIKSEMSLM